MKKKASISFLGIDERPNKRQAVPGLCEEINNLRPTGLNDDPVWVPIEKLGAFKNSAGVSFSTEDTVVSAYWHIRGRIGKNGSDTGSLKRLVIITNAGVVKLIDPDGQTAWEEVATFTVSSSDAGSWDIGFSQMYDIGYITVTKGGVPQADIILEDDLLVEFEFPELPLIRKFVTRSSEKYSQAQIDEENHAGIAPPPKKDQLLNERTGMMFIRYAYRLNDGTLVGHSLPEQFIVTLEDLNATPEYVTSFLNFYFDRYTGLPDNFNFWKNYIRGISVLCTRVYAIDDNLNKRLKESVWYELDTFDFIDVNETADENRYLRFEGNQNDIINLQTADVDDNTVHKKLHGASINYNSRLILGSEKVDFGKPVLSVDDRIFDAKVFADYEGYVTDDQRSPIYKVVGFGGGISNEVNCTVESTFGGYIVDPDVVGDPFTFDITIDGVTETLDLSEEENKFIDTDFSGGVSIETIKMVLEIETETGIYSRVSGDINIRPINIGGSSNPGWMPGSVLSFTDGRAKTLKVYHKSSGLYYLAETYSLSSADKANIAFANDSLKNYSDFASDYFLELTGPEESIDETVNAECSYTKNKVVVSNINSPLSFESDLVYRLGRSSNRVTAFAVNAIALSEGQYGQYPLYVFKEESIFALEQSPSADVVFGRISPVDVSMGVKHQNNITNAGRAIIFSNDSGIYVMEGMQKDKISDPVKSILDSISCVGYYRLNDDDQLVVQTGNRVYHYSLEYGRWFTSTHDNQYTHFFTDNENLYALTESGGVIDYEEKVSGAVPVSILLEPVHFGLPDVMKRFYYFYLRAAIDSAIAFKVTLRGKDFETTRKQLRPRMGSVYNAGIEISGNVQEGASIHKIDTEFDVRYTDKIQHAEGS